MIPILLFVWLPGPIDLDTIPADHAADLDGQLVAAWVTVSTPPYPWLGSWVAGGPDTGDAERAVFLVAEPKQGERIMVIGTIWAIRHPAAIVGGRVIPEWREIRVVE